MILQALKNMYPKASEKVLRAVMKDLEKCRGKNMNTEELADWIGKLVTAHTIEEALRITEDDSKPSQVGDESSFAIAEVGNEGNNRRTVARQYHTARGQQNQLQGDERTTRIYVTASRGLGENFIRRAERNLRKVPRLLERIYESWRSSHI